MPRKPVPASPKRKTKRTSSSALQGKLRRSEALFRAVVEKSAEVISLTSADGTTRYLSPAAWQLLGWTPEELGARTLRELVIPEDRERIASEIERIVRTGADDMAMEFRVRHRDGSLRWVECTGTNLLDDPNVRAIVGNYRDITARRAAADAAHAAEARFRRIVESTSEGIWMYDASSVTTFMNARMAEMLGYTVDEAIGRPVFHFIDAAHHADARARIARRQQGIAERSDLTLQRKDGTPLRASIQANSIFSSDGRFESGLLLVADVSIERQAEEARARLAAIVESSDDAIISMNLEGVITSWNLGAQKLYQYSADEVCGQSIFLLIPAELVDDERRILADVARGDPVHQYETQRRRKDGTAVEVGITLSPVRDAEGLVVGVSKIARDRTERHKAASALRRAEEQLRHAQKMEAVGSLAAGIAHDFNNLLTVILSFSTLAMNELRPDDPLRADLDEVQKAGVSAGELTRQLLAFSRQQVLSPQVLSLSPILSRLQKILTRLIGENIELCLIQSEALGRVHADPGQIEQVIMNLVVNARDAMPRGGKLTIETRNVELDAQYAEAHRGVVAGPHVMMAVTDSGEGMDAATVERIFEPFFTTKEKGKGTGLGLSTVYGIVRQSNGHIWVYSEPGKGTAFRIYFPRTDKAADPERLPTAEVATLRGVETVLVVDDQEQVRSAMRQILSKNGYTVLEAQNGGEAFLICEQHTAAIHLLLTDVIMPRMSGRELVGRVAALRPEMKVLYVSGYTEDAIVHHGVLDSGIAFLQKPITPDALLRRVREVIDAPSVAR